MKIIIILLIFPSVCFAHEHWWWTSEYDALVNYVRDSSGVSTTFPTRSGDDHTKLYINVTRGGLILKLDMPSKAIYSVDKKGKKYYQKNRHLMFLKDVNLDGKLDYYKIKNSPYKKFKKTNEGMTYKAQWVTLMSFSVNNFLHGIPSPYQQ